MSVRENRLVSSIQECHIDLLIAQFFETSVEFREWFVRQVDSNLKIEEYVGSACNVTEGRESDIEMGFIATSGAEHLLLIENKIKESEQPNQLQDYHKRGRRRIERGDWDSYSVCLIAPDKWNSSVSPDKVHSVIQYEQLIEQIGQLNHDASSFGTNLLSHGIQESQAPVDDYSTTLGDIQSKVREDIFDMADFHFENRGKNLVIESQHPDHPNFVRYWIYIAKPPTHTDVRLYLDVDDKRSRKNIAHSVYREVRIQEPEMWAKYETSASNKNVAKTQITHEEYERFPETLVEEVSQEIVDLIQTVHPIMLQKKFSEYHS